MIDSTGNIAGAPGFLAPSYTLVARTPSVDSHWVHDPGLARFADGELVAAVPMRAREEAVPWFTELRRSVDGGATWTPLPTLDFADATPIVHEDRLYILGQRRHHEAWLAMASDDRGATWQEPVTLFAEPHWNCKTAMVRRGDLLYWAMNAGMPIYSHIVAVCCDLRLGLTNPAAWRESAIITPPNVPGIAPPTPDGRVLRLRCLEPNVVTIGDRLRVIARVNDAHRYGIAGLAAVFDLDDRDGALELRFAHYHPVPGAHSKMFMFHDSVSGLHWMLSNPVTDSQNQLAWHESVQGRFKGGAGNERRTLALSYSLDTLNWWPAGIVAHAPLMRQSYMYPCAVIDGDDLVLISRTSVDGWNQHDADLCTCHRVRDFRRLAYDLTPKTD